jgi:hypothetical protein
MASSIAFWRTTAKYQGFLLQAEGATLAALSNSVTISSPTGFGT